MPELIGVEAPRLFTPPLRELNRQTTLGYAAIAFAEEMLDLQLFPWQRWLLIHMLELREGSTPKNPKFRFRKIVILVARQNGKSTLSIVLSLFFMYYIRVAMVIGTAQDLDVAEEIWQGAADIIDEIAELKDELKKIVKVNGQKSIELVGGERYKVKAANRRAGRGLSGDLVLLDEIREHQSWDAWAAITKTTNARPNAMIVALSNAGDMTSVVLGHLRKMGHLALGDPDGIAIDMTDLDSEMGEPDDTLALFEWSAAPNLSIWDRTGWAQANPSMGWGTLTERVLASDARSDPEWVFRTECLCQWPDGALKGPFPPGAWDDCRDNTSEIVGPIWASVDVNTTRGFSYIAFAGRREDGIVHVEIVAARGGTDWVTEWLALRCQAWDIQGVAVPPIGAPVSALLDAFELAEIPVVEWPARDQTNACGILYDLVSTKQLRHLEQPVLDVPAAITQVKDLATGGFVWDRRKSDAGALWAATGAAFLAARSEPPPPEPKILVLSGGDDTDDREVWW